MERIKLPFTLCFCLHNPTDQVLMIKRAKRPFINRFNALGGKLNEGESPWNAVFREVREETEDVKIIKLEEADKIHFGGIVTWQNFDDGAIKTGGMYVYVAHFSDSKVLFSPKLTREGTLTWLPREAVENGLDFEFADNLPYFTAPILAGNKPMEYRCSYNENLLTKVERLVLPEWLIYQ